MKHTPGPWKAGPFNVIADSGAIVADCCARDAITGTPAPAEYAANAKLIAAAPDLLAVCKMVLDRHSYQGTGEPWSDLFKAAREAIAKAEGKP